MSKIIFDNFANGFTDNERDKRSGFFTEGRNVDTDRIIGYVMPGYLAADLSYTNTAMDSLVSDICLDPAIDDAYFIDQSKIYHMTNILGETWNADLDGAGHKYHAITNMNKTLDNTSKMVVYPTKVATVAAANQLLYSYNDVSTNAFIGRYPLTGTSFDDDFLTLVDKAAPHDMMEWNAKLWIADGRYVDKFDGQIGDNGTLTSQAVDVGQGWEITKLFPSNNYIGICAWKKNYDTAYRTESKVAFWDGFSDVVNYVIPVPDNKIENAFNYNGEILLFTKENRSDTYSTLKKLTDNGVESIAKLNFPIAGTTIYSYGPNLNAVDLFRNKLLWGNGGTSAFSYASLFSYGKEGIDKSTAITNPMEAIATVGYYVGALKAVTTNKIFVAITNGTLYAIKKLVSGNAVATIKSSYTDFGQRIKVKYVKVYFKILVASDSLTVSLDTDYGTTTSLGTITYTADRAVTSKKFVKPFTCHALRPNISWVAGGTPISKIVVDYDFISD